MLYMRYIICKHSCIKLLFLEEVIKCNDCFGALFRKHCDDIAHTSNPLHDRRSFIGGYPEILQPLETIHQCLEFETSGKFINPCKFFFSF